MMIKDFLLEQFNLRGETPGVWILSAHRLKRSADIVFNAYEIDLKAMENGSSPLELNNLEIAGVATLLYGLSIENILKAIIIRDNLNPAESGKLREWPGSGHDLLSLAKESGIDSNFSQSQCDILRRLGAFIEWAGKYPVPKKASKIYLRQLNINRPFLPTPLQPYERILLNELFDSLLAVSSLG